MTGIKLHPFYGYPAMPSVHNIYVYYMKHFRGTGKTVEIGIDKVQNVNNYAVVILAPVMVYHISHL